MNVRVNVLSVTVAADIAKLVGAAGYVYAS